MARHRLVPTPRPLSPGSRHHEAGLHDAAAVEAMLAIALFPPPGLAPSDLARLALVVFAYMARHRLVLTPRPPWSCLLRWLVLAWFPRLARPCQTGPGRVCLDGSPSRGSHASSAHARLALV